MYSGGIPESMYHWKRALAPFVVTGPTNYIEIGEQEMSLNVLNWLK